MPYNLLLIPLITGYFILTHSYLYKYNIQRFSKDRILFESILAGVIIVSLGFIVRVLFNSVTFGKAIPFLLRVLDVFPIKKPLYFWTFMFSSLLSLLLTILSNKIIKKYYSKNDPIIWAVNKSGDEIENLFKDSAVKGQVIQVTLKNDKVYIGFCEEIPIPNKTNYLVLSPILSGYRENDTKKLKITTDYEKVVDTFISKIEEERGEEVSKLSLNTDIIIKQDEILTAGVYEQNIFEEFNNSSS